MTTGAIVFSWGASVPGREQKGLEVFGKALEQSEKDLKAGRIHSHKEYFNLIGKDGGFQVVEGEIDSLLALLADDDHQKLIAQATTIAQDFTVTVCQGGSDAAVGEGMARYVSALQEVGWMT